MDQRVIHIDEGSYTPPTKMTALCKFRGMLVIFAVKLIPPDVFQDGKGRCGICPNCGADKFETYHGWVTCTDCGDFAICESAYARISNFYDRQQVDSDNDTGRSASGVPT